MSANCCNAKLNEPILADIGYFYTDNPNDFLKLDESSTWCWQQGCRLMWNPKYPNHRIFYNKMNDYDYGSVEYDLNKNEIVNDFQFPIYDVDSKGKKAASLNFSRLGRLRPGYGYINFKDISEDNIAPDDDGVWICDLESKTMNLIVSLDYLMNYKPCETMQDAQHYVNHLSFSPSGKLLLFFHIWYDGKKRYVRGLTCDINGNNLTVVNQGRMVSHYTWKNDHELLLTGELNRGFSYFFINIYDLNPRRLSSESLKQDGHPSFINENNMILTDSYPSNYINNQSLEIIYENGSTETIAKIYSPSQYKGEYRCDLHPRLNNDSSLVCIDFPDFDGRVLAVFNLNNY